MRCLRRGKCSQVGRGSGIVSCQRHGKDPLVYLKDLLTRLPRMTNRDDPRVLTPRMGQPAKSSLLSHG
jgi:hypothetical protein